MNEDIKLKKEIKRKEYNLIRYSNSSVVNEKIKSNVKKFYELRNKMKKNTQVIVSYVDSENFDESIR